MAPEMLLKQPYGPAVDMYSLAITIWEMVAREVNRLPSSPTHILSLSQTNTVTT